MKASDSFLAPDVPPHAPALIADEGTLTWTDVAEEIARRRHAITGAATCFHQKTSVGFALSFWAHEGTGAVPVLISPRIPEARSAQLFRDAERALAAIDEETRRTFSDVMFTSGSTGVPKAVVHTRAAIRASAVGAQAALPFGPGDRWLLSIPLFHVGGVGILARARVSGGAVVVPTPGASLAANLHRFDVTHVSLVPTQLFDLLSEDAGVAALAACRAVVVGGGPCPRALLARAVERGIAVFQTWGMTETSAMITLSDGDAPYTCGRPLLGREVRVDKSGVLWVRGSTLAVGTLRKDEMGVDRLVPLARDADGFFCTGDRGEITSSGEVIVTGRADAMFISGGENIQPEEIESALLQYDGVAEALVVPVPDVRWGARPVAFLRVRGAVRPLALRAFLETKLPRFAVPDAFFDWPEGQEGKPSRADFAARARRHIEQEQDAKEPIRR